MIIIYLGGIGSGKTLSVIKEIVDNMQKVYINFRLKNIKNCHRIKIADIINLPNTRIQMIGDKEYKTKVPASVNWDFWENVRETNKSYSIVIDEIHNVIHSRRSMSRTNILMSKWVSQIRKILSDHPYNHLYIISQTISKIDKDFRDLAQIIVECKKFEKNKNIYIKQTYYSGMTSYQYGFKAVSKVFKGNPYFRYYDSTELINFADAEEYL